MAATGFTPVYIYASGTAGHIPLAANLTNTSIGSEIGLNYADGNLFFKNASNSVITTPLLQSSGSQSGWLSSTDWTTFNGKQAALISGTNIKTVGGVSLLGSGDVGTIGVGYGGTGTSTAFTAGSVVFAGASGVYTQDNSNLFWNNTNKYLGIGTTSPAAQLANTNSTNAIGSPNLCWRTTANDWGSILLATPASGASYNLRLHNAGATASDYIVGFSSGSVASSGTFVGSVRGNGDIHTTGNVVIDTSGKGIDFSATAGTGTSELLADYEEGTWTPVLNSFTGTATVYGAYTKVGRLVTIYAYMIPTTTLACTNITSYVSGIPYAPAINGQIVNWSVDYGGKSGAINVGSNIYTPTIAATSGIFYLSMTYYV